MKAIVEDMLTNISLSLRRKSITTCSRWACEYRRLGSDNMLWRFDRFPWLRDMHDCNEEMIVGMKAAQMGYTETGLNKTFFTMDIKGKNVLYVLPVLKPDAADFSTSRFDPALESTPQLRLIFTNIKNIGHKRAGDASLFIRSSNSRSQLKSLPVSLVILDEVDEMNQANIPMVFERMSGQETRQAFLVSTPTFENYGIHKFFKISSQNHFFFRCPHCTKLTELVFPDCLVITAEKPTDRKILDSHIICKECKGKLEHAQKIDWLRDGQWVKKFDNVTVEGFYINQLYSMATRPDQIAAACLKAVYDPIEEQELWNSKMGLCHVSKGAKVTDEDLSRCVGEFNQREDSPQNVFVTMGVDVGKWLHVEIGYWTFSQTFTHPDINLQATYHLIKETKVLNFEDLDSLIYKYRVNFCVIDANPEKRKAVEFAQRFDGIVKLCYYVVGMQAKQINISEEQDCIITVDRTSWMDVALGRFINKTIKIPQDTSLEYREQIKVPTKVYKRDKNNNPVGIYVSGENDDHYAHARTYSEIALKLGLSLLSNKNIVGVI